MYEKNNQNTSRLISFTSNILLSNTVDTSSWSNVTIIEHTMFKLTIGVVLTLLLSISISVHS